MFSRSSMQWIYIFSNNRLYFLEQFKFIGIIFLFRSSYWMKLSHCCCSGQEKNIAGYNFTKLILIMESFILWNTLQFSYTELLILCTIHSNSSKNRRLFVGCIYEFISIWRVEFLNKNCLFANWTIPFHKEDLKLCEIQKE